MRRFAGQKKVVAGSSMKLVINYCQKKVYFLKRCYVEIQLTLQNVWGIFRRTSGIFAVFQSFYLFIPQFLAEPLTMICWILVGKQWIRWLLIIRKYYFSVWMKRANESTENPSQESLPAGREQNSRLRSWNARNSSYTLNAQVERCTEWGSLLRSHPFTLLSCYWFAISNYCIFFAAVLVVMCVARIMNSLLFKLLPGCSAVAMGVPLYLLH